MSLEWKYEKLGKLCSFDKEGVNPKEDIKYYHYSFPAFDNNKEPEVEVGKDIKSSKFLFNKGDILFNKLNVKFKRVWDIDFDIDENSICSTEFIPIQAKNIDRNFLYYCLISPNFTNEMKYLSTGTSNSHQRINPKDIKDYDLFLPTDEEIQKKIGYILKLLDKKISMNVEINKNLYNIIEARFKHYVKDFSNLDKVVLSDYCNDIIRGFNSKYVEKSNLINLNQKVNKGDILEKQYFKYLNDDIEVPKEKFAKRKDVLLNSLGDGTLGRVHYYNENTDNVIIDQHITIIRSDENKLPSSYIYQYLKCGAGQYHLNSLISGSTGMLMLNISHIRNLELPILPQKELFEFDNFAKDLFDKISSNTKEIEKLQKLRDTLLPKLMSGEIDVSKINCDLKIIIRKIYIKSSKLFLWRYLSENQNYIKNTKSNETLLKSRTIHKINKFLAKFNARYRYYRQ